MVLEDLSSHCARTLVRTRHVYGRRFYSPVGAATSPHNSVVMVFRMDSSASKGVFVHALFERAVLFFHNVPPLLDVVRRAIGHFMRL